MEDTLKNKLKYLVNKKKTLLEICEALELKDYEVIGLVELMKQDGELLDYVNGEIVKLRKPITENKQIKIPVKNGEVKFLSLSDIHYASKWDNPHLVDYAYELAEKENVDFVVNSGDIFEGDFHNARPNHIYEVKAHGMEQLDYVVDKYPKSHIPTYYITGNYEATYIKT